MNSGRRSLSVFRIKDGIGDVERLILVSKLLVLSGPRSGLNMPETSLAQERGCWRVAEHPIQIDYSHRVLADLERDVVAGFHGLKRGGVEVGGVLLGTRTGQAVTVLGYR